MNSSNNVVTNNAAIEWTMSEGCWMGVYEEETYLAQLSNEGWWKVRHVTSGNELQCRRGKGMIGQSVDDDDEDRNWLVQCIARGV